jgi:hypothetical protein
LPVLDRPFGQNLTGQVRQGPALAVGYILDVASQCRRNAQDDLGAGRFGGLHAFKAITPERKPQRTLAGDQGAGSA